MIVQAAYYENNATLSYISPKSSEPPFTPVVTPAISPTHTPFPTISPYQPTTTHSRSVNSSVFTQSSRISSRTLSRGPFPQITPPLTSCLSSCYLHGYPQASTLTWVRITPTTTVTYATVVALVNNALNTTSYSTIYNTNLGNHSLPSTTNSHGVVTVSIL